MSAGDCGPAVVLVYGDGRLTAALFHACDGGEAYMDPLLRKAVQYAKTHYDSGNILDVLLSEGEMLELDTESNESLLRECVDRKVRHVYYVGYWWDAQATKKTYRVWAGHSEAERQGPAMVAAFLSQSGPINAKRLM